MKKSVLRSLLSLLSDLSGVISLAILLVSGLVYVNGKIDSSFYLLIASIAFGVIYIVFRLFYIKENSPSLSSNLNVAQNMLEIDYVEGQLIDFLPGNKSLEHYYNIFSDELKKWDDKAIFVGFELTIWITGCTPSYTIAYSGYSEVKKLTVNMDFVSDRDGLTGDVSGKPFMRYRENSGTKFNRRTKPFYELLDNWKEVVAITYAPIEHRKKENLNIHITDGYRLNEEAMDTTINFDRDDISYSATSKVTAEESKDIKSIAVFA